MLTKAFVFSDTKSEQLAKLMTSKVRQRVKPGSAIFDSAEEAVSIIAAAFRQDVL
jgi:hypothetical protein